MAKTTSIALARTKIKSIQRACRKTLRYEKEIVSLRTLIADEQAKLSIILDRLKDVEDYLHGGGPDISVPASPINDIAEATNSMIDTLEQVLDIRNRAMTFQAEATRMIEDEEVKKQTWADLATDWPYVPAAEDNLLDANGFVILEAGAAATSFQGDDVRNAVNRIKDLHSYHVGTDGGTASPLTVPANPNRDIRELTIDDDVEE